MGITEYILHCSNCEPSRWVSIKTWYQRIRIVVDLQTDEYVFKAICPHCGKQIINKRTAFK